MSRPRCLLIGAQDYPWTTLSLGLLKAAADADPAVGGRYDVEILNLVAPTRGDVVEAVARKRPDVVGFSCYLWNTAVFFEALAGVRAAAPQALIVLGGPDVYPQARRVLEAHPEVDLVVMGEGERTFPRLLAARLDAAPWGDLPGLAYLRAGAYVQTPDAPLIRDLDSIPSPILSGALTIPADVQRITLESSRGCPFDCSFCDWPGRSQKPREFSVDRVIAELAHVVSRFPDLWLVQFADSDIFLDKPRVKELLRRAKEILSGTNVLLHTELYLGRLDEELMRLLDFPNFLLGAGVQTATPEALKTVNRFFHREKIEAAVKGLRRFAPSTRLSLELIYPLPGDTYEGFLDSYEWTLSLRPELIGAYPALVLPGAEMGRNPERFAIEYSPKPPRRIISLPAFGREDVLSANVKVHRLSAMQRVPVIRNTLGHLPDRGGAGPGRRPRLELHDEFAGVLAREGLLPADAEIRRAEDPFAAGSDFGNALLRDGARHERALALLRRFAAAALRDRGREDLLPVFERYWDIEAQFMRWSVLAAACGPEIIGRIDEDVRDAKSLLWLGLESLTAETDLARRARGEIVHVEAGSTRPYHCLKKVRHVQGIERLGRRPDEGPGADAIVISHLFSRATPAERDVLLSYAAKAARPGSRLILWDGLLGRSPLETLRQKTDVDWKPPLPVWTDSDVAREFAAHGWSAEGRRDRLGDSFRYRFVRA